MTKEFWHDNITDKSFQTLQDLRKRYNFVLIGGWAVYLYTQSLKSKDIDIIVSFEELGKLRADFNLVKNERLKKYEIKMGEFDVDIYVSHWSDLGLPAEYILKNTESIAGFTVPKKEILLALKLFSYIQRRGNIKGKKDAVDVLSLLFSAAINFEEFKKILEENNLSNLLGVLKELLDSTTELPELNLNNKRYADFKKKILKKI
jgi:hypothetical protein